ncbi:hypothetical protein [Clavibacter tessellarius]|uniref:hypothetical protein n=1 Tax=Clavibacter tessellarius TaxID=31965 RepID=UPI0032435EC0
MERRLPRPLLRRPRLDLRRGRHPPRRGARSRDGGRRVRPGPRHLAPRDRAGDLRGHPAAVPLPGAHRGDDVRGDGVPAVDRGDLHRRRAAPAQRPRGGGAARRGDAHGLVPAGALLDHPGRLGADARDRPPAGGARRRLGAGHGPHPLLARRPAARHGGRARAGRRDRARQRAHDAALGRAHRGSGRPRASPP